MAPLWAKLSVDILGDPKLMRAARKGARGIEFLPWLIAWAKRADDGGRLTVNREPAESADYCEQIPGATPHRIAAGLQSLIDLGVLEEVGGVLRFAQWDTRQSETRRPSDAPERVRERVTRHRNALRNGVTETTESKRETKTQRGEGETTPRNAAQNGGLLEACELVAKIQAAAVIHTPSGSRSIPPDAVKAIGPDAWRVFSALKPVRFLNTDASELPFLQRDVMRTLAEARQQ